MPDLRDRVLSQLGMPSKEVQLSLQACPQFCWRLSTSPRYEYRCQNTQANGANRIAKPCMAFWFSHCQLRFRRIRKRIQGTSSGWFPLRRSLHSKTLWIFHTTTLTEANLQSFSCWWIWSPSQYPGWGSCFRNRPGKVCSFQIDFLPAGSYYYWFSWW